MYKLAQKPNKHAKSVLTICLSESLCCDTAETIPVHQIAFRSSSPW